VNTTTTKIIATTIKVALSEEELEAREIYRQLGLSESNVRDLDSATVRGREEDEVSSSFLSSSLSDSSESSRLLAKEARLEEGEY
jgi:RecA-family ATPase